MSTIDEAIKAMVDQSVEDAIANSGLVTEDDFGDRFRDAFGDIDLDDFGVLTNDNLDLSDFGFDPDDFVKDGDLPDFDDFVRNGEIEIESGVVDLMRSYSPHGCSTARAANDLLAMFVVAVLDGGDNHIDQADEVQPALVDFIAAHLDMIEKRRAELKAERKAAKKQAKRDAEAARKAAKKQAKKQQADEQVDDESNVVRLDEAV